MNSYLNDLSSGIMTNTQNTMSSSRCCNCNHMKKYIIKIIKEYCKFCDEETLKKFIENIIKDYINNPEFKDLIAEIIKEICPYCDEEALREFVINICEEYIGKSSIPQFSEYQTRNKAGFEILYNEIIPLDAYAIYNNVESGLYIDQNGRVNISEKGWYKIEWSAVIHPETLGSIASLGLFVDNELYSLYSSSTTTGSYGDTINGSDIIYISDNELHVLEIRNYCSNQVTIKLGNVDNQASITITKYSNN